LLEQADLNSYPSSSEEALQSFKAFPVRIYDVLRLIPRDGARTAFSLSSAPGTSLRTTLQRHLPLANEMRTEVQSPLLPLDAPGGLQVDKVEQDPINEFADQTADEQILGLPPHSPRDAPGGLPGEEDEHPLAEDLTDKRDVASWLEPLLHLHHDAAWGKVNVLWDRTVIESISRFLIWGDTQATAQVLHYYAAQAGTVIADMLSIKNIGSTVPQQWRNIATAGKAWQRLHMSEWWTHLILQALRASLDMAITENGDVLPLKESQGVANQPTPMGEEGVTGGMRHRTIQIGAIVAEIPIGRHNENPDYRLSLPTTVVVSLPAFIIAKLSDTLLDCESLQLLSSPSNVCLRTPSCPLENGGETVVKTATFYVEFGKRGHDSFPEFNGLALTQRPATIRALRNGLARNPFSLHLFAPVKPSLAKLHGKLAVEWAPAQGVTGVDALPRFLADMAHFQVEHLESTLVSLTETLTHLDPQRYWRQLGDEGVQETAAPQDALPQISMEGHHKLLDLVDQVARATDFMDSFHKLVGPMVKRYSKAVSADLQLKSVAKATPAEPAFSREVRQRVQNDTANWQESPWTNTPWQASQWTKWAGAPQTTTPTETAEGSTWQHQGQQGMSSGGWANNPWPSSSGGSTGSWMSAPSPPGTRSHGDYREALGKSSAPPPATGKGNSSSTARHQGSAGRNETNSNWSGWH
jgi:hypothetical protein